MASWVKRMYRDNPTEDWVWRGEGGGVLGIQGRNCCCSSVGPQVAHPSIRVPLCLFLLLFSSRGRIVFRHTLRSETQLSLPRDAVVALFLSWVPLLCILKKVVHRRHCFGTFFCHSSCSVRPCYR